MKKASAGQWIVATLLTFVGVGAVVGGVWWFRNRGGNRPPIDGEQAGAPMPPKAPPQPQQGVISQPAATANAAEKD